jgi:hypothetical protein
MSRFTKRAGQVLALVLAFTLLPVEGFAALADDANDAFASETVNLTRMLYDDNIISEEELADLKQQAEGSQPSDDDTSPPDEEGMPEASDETEEEPLESLGTDEAGPAGFSAASADIVPFNEPITIAAANAMDEGEDVIVEGYVVGVLANNSRIAVQDDTAEWSGIVVHGLTSTAGLAGQWVRVTGKKANNFNNPGINASAANSGSVAILETQNNQLNRLYCSRRIL